MSDLIGYSLGPYEIKLKLGSGGMAEVYQAYDTNLDRDVAIKVLPLQWANDPKFVARFKAEAKIIGRLKHPNIIQVFSADTDSRYCYLVMELVPKGQTLRLKINQGLSIWQSLDLIQQIGDALHYTHDLGIIHRDVKPNNVLIDGDRPLLSDFGLAKMSEATALTHSKHLQGTAAFMAPEQFKGAEVDLKADLYALALMLYEMLTGKVPHLTDTFIAIGIKRNTEKPPHPRKFNPNIPVHIEQALLKALAIRPDDRFESVAEFLKALEPWPNVNADYDTAIPAPLLSQVNNLSGTAIKTLNKRPSWLWYGAGLAFVTLIGFLPFTQSLLIDRATEITTPETEKDIIKSDALAGIPTSTATHVLSSLPVATSSPTALPTATYEPAPIFFDATPEEIILGEEVRLQWDAGKDADSVQLDVIPNQVRKSEGTYLYKPDRVGIVTVTLKGQYLQTGVPFTETVTILVKAPPPTPTHTVTPTATPSHTPTVTPVIYSPPTTLPTPTISPLISEIPSGTLTVISPNSTEETYTSAVTFVWRWEGSVIDNFGFEVRLWQEGGEGLGIHSAIEDNKKGIIKKLDNNEYSLMIGDISSTDPIKRSGSGLYNWSVLLIQLEPYDSSLGIEAPPGQIRIGVPGSGNSNSSDGGGGQTGLN